MDSAARKELIRFIDDLYDQSIKVTGQEFSEFSRGYMAAVSVVTNSILKFINSEEDSDEL